MRRACFAAFLTMLIAAIVATHAAAPAVPDFDREIAPLLARRCLDCHSGSDPKGDLDLSRKRPALAKIKPGKPNDSLLWQRIRDEEMPPKKPLASSEMALLRRWIASGARWGHDPIDPFRVTTNKRAGYDWWALQPITRPHPPMVSNTAWTRNPIDRFILARLESRRLAPSPHTDRRTLIRRVTFDLTGLPPSPEDVEAFIHDMSSDAFERVVDRLLSSPAYGERWGRHWLDIVRFGESDGFERDLPRANAWPYRDWVVKSLNSDLPYDEFVRFQLAGDVLKPGDHDALAAVGFLVAGPHDIVVPVSANMKATMRQDELEDIVGTVGQAFLGLTVHCARCHDHKFDPVSQKDYYRLASALSGVGFGERPYTTQADRLQINALNKRLDVLQTDIAAIEEPIRRRLLAGKGKRKTLGPRPLAEWDFTTSLQDRIGTLHGKAHGTARRDATGLHLDGKTGFVTTAPLTKPLREKTLEAWVRLAHLNQAGGAVIGVQSTDGILFDSIVFAERQKNRWMPGSNNFRRTKDLAGPEEKDAVNRFVHVAITYHADGTITGYRDGRVYGRGYLAGGVQSFGAGKAEVTFGLRHGTSAAKGRMLAGIISRARLYDRAMSSDEVAASAGQPVVRTDEIVAQLKGEQRDRHGRLAKERERLLTKRGKLTSAVGRKLYTLIPSQPRPTHVLARGAVTSKGEVVSAEVVAALAARLGSTKLKSDAPEAQRRLALAKWISAPNNPLFARTIVNRLWHYHFGLGLVETTSDLGFNGGRPSHPELLDWLTNELVRQNFRLKPLHRLIVMSSVYRQSSRPRKKALLMDAENRLLWRKSPLRLEAEVVRDSIMAVSGRLNRQIGGPPFLDFRSYFFKGTQFYEPLEQTGPAFERRSLYRMWARGGRSPFLDTLDCPDPSTTTPRRARTTTPLQALALMNNAFVLHQAKHFAERIRKEAGDDADKQVTRAYALSYGRVPTSRERELVKRFVERHGLEALGRVIFNTSEFIQAD